MNNKLNSKKKQKKIINIKPNKNDKIYQYMFNIIEKTKKDIENIETDIKLLEEINN